MAIKYQLTYRDVNYLEHTLNIYNDAYTDPVIDDITGRVWLESPQIDDPLEPIKGTSLRVELDATSARDFSDLYTEEERVYRCVYLFAGVIRFEGWLNPQGWWESLNEDSWVISFDVVDGLGYLDGLAYVQSSGLNWTGKQSGIEIIANCLSRSGLQMSIYTDIGVRWTGLASNADPLNSTDFNAERFYQEDDEPMSCLEVLKTTLEVFGACIQQRRGVWFVYRPNQLAVSASSTYFGYDYTGTNFTNSQAFDLSNAVDSVGGGTGFNFYANGNQRLSNVNSLGAYSINYEYGLATSLIGANKYLTYGGAAYTDWTINNATNMTFPSAGGQGWTINCITGAAILQMSTNTAITLNVDDQIEFKATVRQSAYPFTTLNTCTYRLVYVEGATTWYCKASGVWTNNPADNVNVSFVGLETKSLTLQPDPMPGTVSGNLTIEVYTPTGTSGIGTHQWLSAELLLNNEDIGNIKGEIHTAQRNLTPSSKNPDPATVYVGDNASDTYVGAMYQAGTSNNTSEWTRDKVAETKPLLQIACEDRLRMNGRVRKVFSGDVFGYFEPLSVLTLNNAASGLFLPTSYNYNSMTGVISVTAIEIIDDELADIDYDVRNDYGNTVKPKIRG